MTPIITSSLDTDLYKLTMMQCIYHHFPKAEALYRFQCRNDIATAYLKETVQTQVDALGQLKFQDDDIDYLATLPFFKPDFLEYLNQYRFDTNQVAITKSGQSLAITITGPWVETILYEVPLLAIVSECYTQGFQANETIGQARAILEDKIGYLNHLEDTGFSFTDFGTRRRFSKAWQHEVIATFKAKVPKRLAGTSNIWLAKKHDVPVIGTMAHEYLQACQVLAPNILESQKYALETWYDEYQGQLGIALTDSITMDVFLREFNQDLATKYIGLRQDSGDPFAWTEKALQHYAKLGIDTRDKVFVYSDRLTLPKAYTLYETYKDKVKLAFGIGTHITNDVGIPPLDIVIKLNQLNGQHVVKISDSTGKAICDDDQYLKEFKNKLGIN